MGDFNNRFNRAVWFDVPVVDLDRAVAFYAAILGVDVMKEQFGDVSFGLIDHEDGNGGCLVERPEEVSATGLLVYMNAEGRIRDVVAMAVEHGGSIVEDVQSIGPHGFRAVVLDSEGNRIALHSTTDE